MRTVRSSSRLLRGGGSAHPSTEAVQKGQKGQTSGHSGDNTQWTQYAVDAVDAADNGCSMQCIQFNSSIW